MEREGGEWRGRWGEGEEGFEEEGVGRTGGQHELERGLLVEGHFIWWRRRVVERSALRRRRLACFSMVYSGGSGLLVVWLLLGRSRQQ